MLSRLRHFGPDHPGRFAALALVRLLANERAIVALVDMVHAAADSKELRTGLPRAARLQLDTLVEQGVLLERRGQLTAAAPEALAAVIHSFPLLEASFAHWMTVEQWVELHDLPRLGELSPMQLAALGRLRGGAMAQADLAHHLAEEFAQSAATAQRALRELRLLGVATDKPLADDPVHPATPSRRNTSAKLIGLRRPVGAGFFLQTLDDLLAEIERLRHAAHVAPAGVPARVDVLWVQGRLPPETAGRLDLDGGRLELNGDHEPWQRLFATVADTYDTRAHPQEVTHRVRLAVVREVEADTALWLAHLSQAPEHAGRIDDFLLTMLLNPGSERLASAIRRSLASSLQLKKRVGPASGRA